MQELYSPPAFTHIVCVWCPARERTKNCKIDKNGQPQHYSSSSFSIERFPFFSLLRSSPTTTFFCLFPFYSTQPTAATLVAVHDNKKRFLLLNIQRGGQEKKENQFNWSVGLKRKRNEENGALLLATLMRVHCGAWWRSSRRRKTSERTDKIKKESFKFERVREFAKRSN